MPLTQHPFSPEIAPDDLFPSATARELDVRLTHLLDLRGVVLITGDAGSGKTCACRRVLTRLHTGLYRVIYDVTSGPREVSARGSHFPLRVDKSGGSTNDAVISWEDTRSDATQPRDDGNADPNLRQPLQPVREFTIWQGTIGNWSSHAVVPGSRFVAWFSCPRTRRGAADFSLWSIQGTGGNAGAERKQPDA